MTDRPTTETSEAFDRFERRLASELERYVAGAVDPRSPAEVADGAMVARGVAFRGATTSARPNRRRILLIGLAAVLAIPAVYLGAGAIRRTPAVPAPVGPGPSAAALLTSTATPGPTTSSVPPLPPRATLPPVTEAMSIFVRRTADPAPGVAVYAAGPDGAEVLIRTVPDSVVDGGKLTIWGTVSGTGWLALGSEVNPWPVVVLDLRDAGVAPWVVNEASTGGIGPRWGPTGLLAADGGGNGARVVIADPETRTTRVLPMHGGFIGGGPTIVWAADGSAIVGSTENGAYQRVPIDGGDPRPGVGEVFDPRGAYGPDLAELRICNTADSRCGGPVDGRVEREDLNGNRQTVWTEQGVDRALAAGFGAAADEYWIATSHADGTQIALVHVTGTRTETYATINRDATWQYVGAPFEAPDGSASVVWLDLGARTGAVIVPAGAGKPTFHDGSFAGFVDRAAIAAVLTGTSPTPGRTLAPTGEAYRIASLHDLIAAELALNPGEEVLGTASHDAVVGDAATRTTVVRTEMPGGSVYLDCFGAASVTVTTGAGSITNPCLAAGAYEIDTGTSAPITVTARGDTSWRVVVYIMAPPDGSATPPPVPG